MNKFKLINEYLNAFQKHYNIHFNPISRLYGIIRLSITTSNNQLLELISKLK